VCGFTEGKGSPNILEPCYWAHTERDGCSISVTPVPALVKKGLKEAIDRLKPLFTDQVPVENPPKIPEKIQWVQPRLVCEVAFAEWTEDKQLRQTTFSDGETTRVRKKWYLNKLRR
jgi:ATP-dependent DNA ligase